MDRDIVMAGDIHCHWANHLQVDSSRDDSPVVGVEFVGKPGAPLQTRKSFVVEAGRPGLRES